MKIKSEYVTGYGITLKDLAEKYGLSFSYLQRKSANNGWTNSRLEYRSRVEKKVEEELAIDAASEQAELVRIGKTLMGIGLRNIIGENPRFKPKNAGEVLKIIKVGSKIVSDNLTKLEKIGGMNRGNEESQKILRDLAKEMGISLEKKKK